MSDVLISFAGKACISGSLTVTPGIAYSQGSVLGDRSALDGALFGDLELSDGTGGRIRVTGMTSIEDNEPEETYEGDGTLVLTLVDDRIEWRFGTPVTLVANVLRDDGVTYDPDTLHPADRPYNWRELVDYLIEQGGLKSRFRPTAVLDSVKWTPTGINWDHDPPLLMLQRDLLEPIGYFVVRQLDGTVEIHQYGVGAEPPAGELERRPLTRRHRVVDRPTHVRVVGGRQRVQETITGCRRCLPMDGALTSGVALASTDPAYPRVRNGVLRPWTETISAWGYTVAKYTKGILLRSPFANYTAGGTKMEQRQQVMRQFLNRFMLPEPGTLAARQRLPLLNKLLLVGSGGVALSPLANADHWYAIGAPGGTAAAPLFANALAVSGDATRFPAKIIDAHVGMFEILSDLPVGRLSRLDKRLVEDPLVTLDEGFVALTCAYRRNTGSDSDFFTLERTDPQAAEADKLYKRSRRVFVIKRPDYVVDVINGAVAESHLEVSARASALCSKVWEASLEERAYEYVYNGIVPVRLDGRIRRVTYQVPASGMPQTLVYVDTDEPASPFEPSWDEAERRFMVDTAVGKSEELLVQRVQQRIEESLMRARSVKTENGEGGLGDRRNGRQLQLGWLHALPVADETASNGRAMFGRIVSYGPGGVIGFTDEGPIAQAFFETSQAPDYAPNGMWLFPGYYLGDVRGVGAGGPGSAEYTLMPVDLGGGTSSGSLLPLSPAGWFHFPRMFRYAFNELASAVNSLIAGGTPPPITLLSAGHAKMSTGDKALWLVDHAGEGIVIPNTDFRWPPGTHP